MKLLSPTVYIGVASYDDYVKRQQTRAAFDNKPITMKATSLAAYVNEGRWVADCPNCGSGIALDRDWADGRCLGLAYGFVYPITWPSNADAIESALIVRNRLNQSWVTTETVSDLHAENTAHGLPVDDTVVVLSPLPVPIVVVKG